MSGGLVLPPNIHNDDRASVRAGRRVRVHSLVFRPSLFPQSLCPFSHLPADTPLDLRSQRQRSIFLIDPWWACHETLVGEFARIFLAPHPSVSISDSLQIKEKPACFTSNDSRILKVTSSLGRQKGMSLAQGKSHLWSIQISLSLFFALV